MKKIIIGILIIVSLILAGYIFQLKQELKTKEIVKTDSKSCNYLAIDSKQIDINSSFFYDTHKNEIEEKNVSSDLKSFIVSYIKENSFRLDSGFDFSCFEDKICNEKNTAIRSMLVDLNDDNVKERIVMPLRVCDCSFRGASGNGDILVIRQINNKWETIGNLRGNGYAITKQKTNSYHDILTNSHGSAVTGMQALYKWQVFSNGSKTNGEYEEIFNKSYDLSRNLAVRLERS